MVFYNFSLSGISRKLHENKKQNNVTLGKNIGISILVYSIKLIGDSIKLIGIWEYFNCKSEIKNIGNIIKLLMVDPDFIMVSYRKFNDLVKNSGE